MRFLLITFLLGTSARAAAPLVDHVPADAVAYVGWAGADAQAAAYQSSNLKTFIENSNLPQLARQYFPKWIDQLNQSSQDPQATAALQRILPLLWRHPVAVYLSNLSSSDDGTPDANLVLLCDAGPDAPQLQSDLKLLTHATPHLKVSLHDSLITLGLDRSAQTPPQSQATLATNPRFIATLQNLTTSPAIAVYLDASTLLQKLDESAAKDTHGAADIWPKVRDALGITNIKTLALTAGFDGPNWTTASLLEAPAPRTGLLAAIEPQPIDPLLLARIPASAQSVSVYNLDLAKLIDTIGNAMSVRPESDKLFHQVNGALTMVLGANLRRQILGPLGPQWVLYSDSTVQGALLINHPNRPATASDSLVSVLFGIVNLANSHIPGAAAHPVVTAVQSTVNHIDVTSAVTTVASPSVAVKGDVLYFGLTPESVVAAATNPDVPPPANLLRTDHFLSAVKQLNAADLASFNYSDLPLTAPKAYDNFAKLQQQLGTILSPFKLDLPQITLPPLDQLRLSPALSACWADADAIHWKSISPFPLSTALLSDPQQAMVSTGVVAAGAAILVPSLQRARAQALLVQSISQERQILTAMVMYQTKHNGQLPPDLGSLMSDDDLPATSLKLFLQPGSDQNVPAEISTGTTDEMANWVNDHAEYTQLAPGRNASDLKASQTPVLLPKDPEKITTPVPVGFADGHIEAVNQSQLQKYLHPQNP
jgi:type II secretory pathway pseudopilin PulG